MMDMFRKKNEGFFNSKPGIYLHIPFCRKKCPYCSFYSIADSSFIPEWKNALKKEMDFYRRSDILYDSLYLGGGTPTLLDIKDIEDIMGLIFKNYSFTGSPEITIEANPDDLNGDKIRNLNSLGFNRISIGAQSFDDDILCFLKRTHTVQQTKKSIELLRSSGFKNIGIDLIYGFSALPFYRWKDSIMKSIEFEPEHLSCYQLSCDNGTVFGSMVKRGKMKLPDENQTIHFFMETSKLLEKNGYIHYEVSSYAKGIESISYHNEKYWKREPYLGLGPSAHSFDGEKRWWNVNSVKKYCQLLNDGVLPIDGFEYISKEQKELERIVLGIRTKNGFNLEDIDKERLSSEAPQ